MTGSDTDPCVEVARAKINLALHVTDRRADGYHDLGSLVVFASTGDRLTASPANTLSLSIQGRSCDTLPLGPDNSVLAAARSLMAHAEANGLKPACSGADLVLEKNLPVSAGIGGGSADAAATLRALNRLWGLNLPQHVLEQIGTRLGADVAICVGSKTCRMEGIGEQLSPLDDLQMPSLDLVLVNPGVPVATPEVFQALQNPRQSPLPPLPKQQDLQSWLNWLGATRNDLFEPACELCPEIRDVISALGQEAASLSRMSGSGATCFGIFDNPHAAEIAANALKTRHPDWWICATRTV